jgi:hypothetical protein
MGLKGIKKNIGNFYTANVLSLFVAIVMEV